MAILDFQRPDKVIMLEDTATYGKFEFRPLEPGYAKTIGNPLRRILLSSLEGHAIYAVKIDGVAHEFDTIDGVVEDVSDIILNLKQVRFKKTGDEDNEVVNLTVSGKDFTGKNIESALQNFEVLNKDLLICTMNKDVSVSITLYINKGRGYVPAEENVQVEDVNAIAMDTIYTPIKHVKYYEEDFRVEQKTDFEKLTLEMTTDGSIHPKDALVEAAKILIQHYVLFSDDKLVFEEEEPEKIEIDDNLLHIRQTLKKKLTEVELSIRALNCLQAAEIETIGDLVQLKEEDLMKFRNFGKKSMTELEELLTKKNLRFGMDISKYELDK